jgi:hypothetical protein
MDVLSHLNGIVSADLIFRFSFPGNHLIISMATLNIFLLSRCSVQDDLQDNRGLRDSSVYVDV